MAESSGDAKKDVAPLLNHIAQYEREFKKWLTRAEKIIDRYRDEKRGTGTATAHFNILWSNVQTLVPATFSRTPKADVSRRFNDNDPTGRVASLLLERSLDFELEHYPDFRQTLKQCVYDRFLGGRGTAWVRYEPHIKTIEPEDGVQVTEDTDDNEVLEYECAPVDYVHWRDFGHQVARTWEEVNLVWRKVYMTRAACIERFGEEVGKKIPLDSKPDDNKNNKSQSDNKDDLALIYEVWDKEEKTACWLSKSLGEYVDERPDPLELEEFFPCPRPLFATVTNDSLIPVPDFTLYQDQAAELDVLCDRIQGLIEALQVKGVYNAEFPVLGRLFTEGENGKLLPVKDFAAFAEKQGLKGAIDLVELEPIYEALLAAYKAMEEVKQQIYDITGLSDIVRGSSEAQETATAQQIKGNYASMRLNSMKREVSEFASGIIKLKAQIITKFQPEQLMQIGGAKQMTPEDQAMLPAALQLLQDGTRIFRIDIEADSLVQMDEQQERQDRTQFVQAIGGALKEAGPMVQAAPELGPFIIEMIKFTAAAFKAGKAVEGSLDAALDQMKKVIQQKQASPPQPTPEQLKLQSQEKIAADKAQADVAKVQAETQADAQRLQMEQQAEGQRLQQEQFFEQQRMHAETQQRAVELQMEQQAEAQRNQLEAQRVQFEASLTQAFDKWKAILDSRTKIEVEEISAGATLDAAKISAAKSAAP